MKPTSYNRFLKTLVILPLAISFTSAQPANPPVFHGHLKVDQLDAGNNGLDTPVPSVATQIVRKAGPGTTTTADRGDWGIAFGYADTFRNGVLLSSVRENGRNNGTTGDPNLTVYSTSSAWPGATGESILSGHSIANLAGTIYAQYDGGTGPSFDGGVTGSSFIHTARPVAGFRPSLYPNTQVALGQSHVADVTSLVKDWAAGSANNGLVVQTPRVGTGNGFTTDGWQICTSSNTNISYRPKLNVEYLPPAAGTNIVEFQDGLAGYDSTVDAQVSTPVALAGSTAVEKTLDGSTIETEWIDLDGGVAGSPWNQQGLFRFDNIIGAGKIAPGAKIARAYFVLATNASGNSPTNGPAVVRQMLKPWTPASLSSSFGPNGLTEADGVVGPELDNATAVGAYGEAWFDVTSSVQSWADGGTNNGFHVSCTADGWRIFFSGAPLAASRPRLVVVTAPAGQTITPSTASFQNGVGGYTGTVDRAVSSTASENRDGSAIGQYFLDGWNGTDSPQQSGLIRFENLIGGTAGSIPAGSKILKAELTLTSGSSASAQSNGIFGIARLLEPFETASGNTYSTEWNVDLGYAFFPFSDGWIGGLATNQAYHNDGTLVDFLLDSSGNYRLDANNAQISANNQQLVTLIGSQGLTIGDEESLTADFLDYSQSIIGTGNGYYQLFLPGIDPVNDGILLVGGGKNEGNYALSKPVYSDFDGGGWEIICHDNRGNGGGGENDAVAFVYVPKSAVADGKAKALGRIMGDGSAAIQAGSFTVTKVEATPGQWLLKIDGGSDAKGTLIISPEGRGQRETIDEFGNAVVQPLFNVDNIVNYQWSAELGGWLVESRDLPSAGLQNLEPDEGFFNFAYFEYPAGLLDANYQAWADANGLDESTNDPMLDGDGDGLKNFAEFALGTNPKSNDLSKATAIAMTGESNQKQLSITYARRTDAGAKFGYVVEYSDDMKIWAPSLTAVESVATATAPLYEMVTVKDDVVPGAKARFVRVRLVYTP